MSKPPVTAAAQQYDPDQMHLLAVCTRWEKTHSNNEIKLYFKGHREREMKGSIRDSWYVYICLDIINTKKERNEKFQLELVEIYFYIFLDQKLCAKKRKKKL